MRAMSRLRSWKQIAFVLCAALLLGMLSSYVLLLVHGEAGPRQTDFMPYFSAGSLVLQGHGASVYDLAALGRFERALVHPLHVRDGVMPYLYPPTWHCSSRRSPLCRTTWRSWYGWPSISR